MDNTLISIIIPVYNSEKYISKTVKSILKQKDINYEIILVNDGSTDKSADICKKLNKKYNNIKVIHQNNKGPANARNVGLKEAKGKYILFVDADDIIKDNAIKLLKEHIQENNSDLIIFGYECQNNIGDKVKISKIIHKKRGCTIDEFKIDFCKYLEKWYLSLLTNKLYKAELLKKYNIKFNENLKNSEDLLFNFSYIRYCNNISIVPEILYRYIKNNEQSISSIYHENLVEMQKYVFKELKNMIKDINADTEINNRFIEKQYLSINFSMIYNIYNNKYKLNKEQKQIIVNKIINDIEFIKALKNNYNKSTVYKIFFILLKIKSYILIENFMKFMNIFNKIR